MNEYAVLLDHKTKSPYSRLLKAEHKMSQRFSVGKVGIRMEPPLDTTTYTLLLRDPIFGGSQHFQVECRSLSMMSLGASSHG